MPKDVGAFTIDADDQARLGTYLGIDTEGRNRDGSVVVDCFDWWATEKYTGAQVTLAEKTILEMVLEEFELYHAHLRLINKKPISSETATVVFEGLLDALFNWSLFSIDAAAL